MTTFDAASLRAAWLGRHEAMRAAELERSLIESDDMASALREAEYDLIDDYVADRLDPVDREAVAKNLFPASDFRQKFEVAAVLLRAREESDLAALKSTAATKHHQRRRERGRSAAPDGAGLSLPPISRHAVLAVVAIVVLALALLRLAAGLRAAASSEAADEVAYVRASTTLSLARDLASAEEGMPVKVPKGLARFVLDLDTGGRHPGATYSVAISTGGRESIYRGLPERRSGAAAFVELNLPLGTLYRQDDASSRIVDIHLARDDDASDAKDWRLRLADSE